MGKHKKKDKKHTTVNILNGHGRKHRKQHLEERKVEALETIANQMETLAILQAQVVDHTTRDGYPYPSGDTQVLGPEVFAGYLEDGTPVISWKGENFTPQPEPEAEKQPRSKKSSSKTTPAAAGAITEE